MTKQKEHTTEETLVYEMKLRVVRDISTSYYSYTAAPITEDTHIGLYKTPDTALQGLKTYLGMIKDEALLEQVSGIEKPGKLTTNVEKPLHIRTSQTDERTDHGIRANTTIQTVIITQRRLFE